MSNDVYGKGLIDCFNGNKDAVFTVESDIAETEEWPISLFFRNYEDMSELEKIVLFRTEGAILDVGAGAGSHALWLQEQGKNVVAIDVSEGAVEVMKERRVKNVDQKDFYLFEGQKFDTLLLLMNGIGIAGKLDNLPRFFERVKKLLNPGGRILLDSSDLIYLFEEEEDGSVLFDLNEPYYGELEYKFIYRDEEGEPFDWLFVDFGTLSEYASLHGFSCEKIYEDDHYLYLAELKMEKL